MRPAHLATDTASSRDAMLDVLDWADANGLEYDCAVLLQPTSPLRTAEDILGCLSLYSDDVDMAVSVKECSANPYYNCFEPDENGFLKVSKGDGLITRRQDAPPAYEMNGAVYVINPKSLREKPMGAFAKRAPYLMPAERSIDIDHPIDLLIAEKLLETAK
ncbi:MAG: acylneuraminate cytidylyltransferase family protein, partial [Clostridium sp.]|nr:acylneuraminate cytidylyltransferase family protein [Clostridium sp.]